MYCISCGTENVDAAQFCFKCGASQVPSPTPTSWPSNNSTNYQPTTDNSVQGYGYAANNPSGNYTQPLTAPNSYAAQQSYAPVSGPLQQPGITINNNMPPRPMVVMVPKSVGTAIVLAIFFGPLGMLYSTVPGGLVMLLINVILVIPTLGTVLFITWPAGIVWAAVAANTHNSKLYGYVQGG